MNKRWYDVDPTVSLAVSLMRNANIMSQYKCADLIVAKSKENGINYVLHEIESKWFYARRESVPDEIISLFNKTKEKAEELGLKYVLYERAEHMMAYKNKKEELSNE